MQLTKISEDRLWAHGKTKSLSLFVQIVKFDNKIIGDGKPGKQSLRLREIYIGESMKEAL